MPRGVSENTKDKCVNEKPRLSARLSVHGIIAASALLTTLLTGLLLTGFLLAGLLATALLLLARLLTGILIWVLVLAHTICPSDVDPEIFLRVAPAR